MLPEASGRRQRAKRLHFWIRSSQRTRAKVRGGEAAVGQGYAALVGGVGWGGEVDGRDQRTLVELEQRERGLDRGVAQALQEMPLEGLERRAVGGGVQAAGEHADGHELAGLRRADRRD